MKAVPASRYVVFFSIVIAGCLIDLATKSWAFGWLGMPDPTRPRPPWWLWENVLGFETSLNDGALFGIGQGLVAVFAGLSIVAAIGILLWLFVAGAARDWLLTVALACVTAGIFGNLYDRLGLPGLKRPTTTEMHQAGDPVYAVRDWIKMIQIGERAWPNYNVADSLLVCGAALLVWHAFSAQSEPRKQPSKPESG